MREKLITMSHVRAAGFCATGLRDFCKTHEIDLRRLVREGVPMSEVEHIQDANLQRVVQSAKEDKR